MKKKHGWVIQDWSGDYVEGTSVWTPRIKEALVFSTRNRARGFKFGGEVVCKVELYKNGKAKKVIPGR